MLGCEEKEPAYAADIINTYILESFLLMETITPLNDILDLTFNLYAGNGNLLDSDDDSGIDWNPSLSWTCQASGDYYFAIEGFWSEDYGNYTVSVVELQGLSKQTVIPEEKRARTEKRIRYSDLLFK